MSTADFINQDLTSLSPYGGDDADYIAKQKATAHALLSSLSIAPAAVIGSVVPDPKTGIPGTGMMSQLYGFGNMLLNGLTMNPAGVNMLPGGGVSVDEGAAHGGLDLLYASQVEAAGERSYEKGRELIPPMTPQGPAEEVGQGIVDSIARTGIPGTGGLLSKLGPTAKLAAEFLQPGMTGAAVPIMAGAAGGAGAVGSEMDKANQPLTFDTSELPTPPIPPTTPSASLSFDHSALNPASFSFDTSGIDGHQVNLDTVHADDGDWTYAQAFSGAATVAALVGGLVTHRLFRADTMKAAEIKRYEDISSPIIQAADTVGAGVGGTDAVTNPPVVPLPGKAGRLDTQAANLLVNKVATLNALNDFHAGDEVTAEILRSRLQMMSNDMVQSQHISNTMESGHDKRTGVKGLDIVKLHDEIAAGTDAQRDAFNNLAHIQDELDNRTNKFKAGVTDEAKRYVNQTNFTDAELRQQVLDHSRDPVIVDWQNRRNLINNRLTDMLVEAGIWTPADRARTQAAHPNFMSDATINGDAANPLNPRGVAEGSGGVGSSIPVWERDAQHFEDMMRVVQLNDMNRATFDNVYASQQNNPKFAKLFEPSKNSSEEWVKLNDKQGIPLRVNGELQWHKVNNPEIRVLMQRSSSMQNPLISAAGMVGQLARSGTTQALAAVAGHVFAPTSLAYSTTRAMIAKPEGFASGYLDKALQAATKGKVGLAGGLDPTAYLGPVIGTAQNVYAKGLEAFSNILAPTATNPMVQELRKQFGQQAIDAISQRALLAFHNSAHGAMKEEGLLHSAGMMAAQIPTSELGARGQKYGVMNSLVPELHAINNPIMGKQLPKFIRLNNMFKEMLELVSSGEHTFMYGLNRNSRVMQEKFGQGVDDVLNARIRGLTGDPSARGTSQSLRAYNSMSPYPNVRIQDAANLIGAIKQAPFQTALRIATTIGVPVAAELYTAMLSGPDALNHLFNEQTNNEQGAKVSFYIPGQPPENRASIPIEQNARMFVPVIRQLLFDLTDAMQHAGGEGRQWAMNGFEDFFSRHITHGTMGASLRGLQSVTDDIPVPSAINGVLAAANKRLTINPLEMATGDKPAMQTLLQNAGPSGPRVPNAEPGPGINGASINNNMFQRVIASVFGIAGEAANQYFTDATQAYNLTNDPTAAWTAFKQGYVQRLQDSLPMARGVVWNSPGQLSTASPLANHVNEAVNSLRPLMSMKSDMKYDGFTAAKGMPIDPTPGAATKVPTDPIMLAAYMTAAKSGAHILNGPKAPMYQVEQLRKVISSLPISGLPPQQIRQLHNEYTRSLNNALTQVNDQLNDLDDTISGIVGSKTTISKVDWTKGPEQFSGR